MSIAKHVPFAKKVAMRMMRRVPNHIMADEIVAIGMLGLLDAASKVDPSHGENFEKYAEFRIKGAILDETRRRDHITRDGRTAAKDIARGVAIATMKVEGIPEEEDIAEAMGVTVDEYRYKRERFPIFNICRYAESVSKTPSQYDDLLRRQQLDIMRDAIAELDRRSRIAIRLRHKGATYSEIGKALNISQSRAHNIIMSANAEIVKIAKGRLAKDEKMDELVTVSG